MNAQEKAVFNGLHLALAACVDCSRRHNWRVNNDERNVWDDAKNALYYAKRLDLEKRQKLKSVKGNGQQV